MSAFAHIEPALKTLAPVDGYAHVGPSGAGHFVKMVHNGIEYGMMAAYGEGFELLAGSQFNLDLHQVSALWSRGSVVRSWLLELAELAFERDPRLESIEGYVDGFGRRPLDGAGGARPGRAAADHHALADAALRVAAGRRRSARRCRPRCATSSAATR